jgi:hypothetical protein
MDEDCGSLFRSFAVAVVLVVCYFLLGERECCQP